MQKIILQLSAKAIKKVSELLDDKFDSDETCSLGSLPASKEWSEFCNAWGKRKIVKKTKEIK